MVLVAKKVVISFPWGLLNKHRRVALRTIGANSLQLICSVNILPGSFEHFGPGLFVITKSNADSPSNR